MFDFKNAEFDRLGLHKSLQPNLVVPCLQNMHVKPAFHERTRSPPMASMPIRGTLRASSLAQLSSSSNYTLRVESHPISVASSLLAFTILESQCLLDLLSSFSSRRILDCLQCQAPPDAEVCAKTWIVLKNGLNLCIWVLL